MDNAADAPHGRRRFANQGAVRAHNLEAVGQFVRSRRQTTRGDIGRALALNKVTVSSLVGELLDRGLLEEGDTIPGVGAGRRSTRVSVDSSVHASIVVQVTQHETRVTAWSLALTKLLDRTIALDTADLGASATLQQVAATAAEVVRVLRGRGRRLTGVALAVPGVVDARAGRLVASGPLGWSDIDLRRPMLSRRQLADLPLLVGRLANFATIAEWRAERDTSDLVCVYGTDTGLGCGAIVNGALLTGSRGQAGELRFPSMVETGPLRHLGLDNLLRLAKVRTTKEPITALLRRQDDGDTSATRALRTLAEQVSERLATVVCLLDPTTVVLGGYLAELGPPFLHMVTEGLSDALGVRRAAGIQVRAGSYGASASDVGGAVLLADRVFDIVADHED
jgi:predicted NBD/HSP70 family sugar kinase